jgi:hypothetical protein
MLNKIIIKNKNVNPNGIQYGENTHHHDHDITCDIFNNKNINTKHVKKDPKCFML